MMFRMCICKVYMVCLWYSLKKNTRPENVREIMRSADHKNTYFLSALLYEPQRSFSQLNCTTNIGYESPSIGWKVSLFIFQPKYDKCYSCQRIRSPIFNNSWKDPAVLLLHVHHVVVLDLWTHYQGHPTTPAILTTWQIHNIVVNLQFAPCLWRHCLYFLSILVEKCYTFSTND